MRISDVQNEKELSQTCSRAAEHEYRSVSSASEDDDDGVKQQGL